MAANAESIAGDLMDGMQLTRDWSVWKLWPLSVQALRAVSVAKFGQPGRRDGRWLPDARGGARRAVT